MLATDETVGLTEWIIDETCLVKNCTCAVSNYMNTKPLYLTYIYAYLMPDKGKNMRVEKKLSPLYSALLICQL